MRYLIGFFIAGTIINIILSAGARAQSSATRNTRLVQAADGLYDYVPGRGDELRYVVTYADGSQYDFVITLMQYDYPSEAEYPVAFRWDIGEPLNSTGLIELCSSCLKNAVFYLNYFKDGTYFKYKEFTTVFVSEKNFSEAVKSTGLSTEMIMDGESLTFYSEPENSPFPVQVNGKTIPLRARKLSNLPGKKGDKEIIFLPGNHRLIVSMTLNFSIVLKEIKMAE